jgi:hypothetical protein
MIKLIQCLCPSRHCIIAVAFDPARMAEAQAVAQAEGVLTRVYQDRLIDPWCAICGSSRFEFEVGTTTFRTLEEAAPAFAASAVAQQWSRRWLWAHQIEAN